VKILVATREGQGERAGDFFEADEGEFVMPVVMCDQLHEGCVCNRVMVGVRTGKETTTAVVVESDMSRAAYRKAIREGASRAFAGLGLPALVFDRQADELLKLASELPAGVVIERDGDDFNPREATAGVAAS
jgi:hypothetical protein